MDIEPRDAETPEGEEPDEEEVLEEETEKAGAGQKTRINTIKARNVSVKDSAVGTVRGESVKVNLENGVIGAVVAAKVKAGVTNGAIGAVFAQSATVKESQISILVAGQVRGDARILFDMRAGLVAGLAAGLVMVAFKLIMGRRS
ncbi:MAG: hypothetical protein M1434_06315 [Chloroflexi bacterium]|nr:hypothetical protein [Chloroflexota bacterium]MCL5274349.1 hypothetical protein [Chloroflexota bacterium]